MEPIASDLPVEHPVFARLDSSQFDEIAALLADDPALAPLRDVKGVSLLMRALYAGARDLAQTIMGRLKALDVFEAAAMGQIGALRRILAQDPAAKGARSADGFTALHFAGYFNREDAARALIAAGADPNAKAENAMAVAPLHSAIAARAAEILDLLLAVGADANARQEGGWTALMGAAKAGQTSLCRNLLKAGANPDLVADSGENAADLARAAGHDALADELDAALLVKTGGESGESAP